MSKRFLAVIVAISATSIACGDGDAPTSASGNIPGTTLQLSFTGLTPLQGGFHYEGWAIIGGQPFPTGKFNVTEAGSPTTLSGTPIAGGIFSTNVDVGIATAIVITVEPAGDRDTLPSASKILAGSISNRSAALAVAAPQALGNDFGAATGVFVLATPTDGEGNNETSGVWFLDLRSGSPGVGLSLPALPAGWEYEGWAVINGRPVTTGRFSMGSGRDSAAPYSGPLPAPPFPGEDFLVNAPAGLTFPLDLGGSMAVITIEPSPDDSPAPFGLKPLVGLIPTGARDHVTLPMSRAELPRGGATVR